MQQTSATWRRLWAAGCAWVEAKAIIAGTEYTGIAPVIRRSTMQDGPGIGNAVSASLSVSVRTTDTIPRAAQVEIWMRLTDGTDVSEWLPAGRYYISRRSLDPVSGIQSFECYDALLKANAVFDRLPWTTETGEPITTEDGTPLEFEAFYPRDMAGLVGDICNLLGVTLDARTVINTGPEYVVDAPAAGANMRDLLGVVAAAHGGNWIITPAGKLRLVPMISAAGASGATGDVVDVEGTVGSIYAGSPATISGIRYTAGDAEPVLIGDETGIIIDVKLPFALAYHLAQTLIGTTYQPYALSGAIYDPAAELGDYVRSGSDVASVLYSESVTLGPAMRGDIAAPGSSEIADEYPYIGAGAKTLSEAKAYAVTAAKAAADALEESLTQEEIFNRLTGDGAEQGLILYEGKLYLNASYISAGTVSADILKGGTLRLGGVDNGNGVLEVYDANGNIIGAWKNDGINMSQGSLYFSDANGDYISLNRNGGIFSAKKTGTQGTALFYINTFGELVVRNYDNPNTGIFLRALTDASVYMLQDNAWRCYLNSTGFRYINDGLTNNPSISVEDDSNLAAIYTNYIGVYYKTAGGDWATYSSISDHGIYTLGDLHVSGTKSRVVDAGQYAKRLLYCYETASPMFGDIGEGVIGEDGKCYVAFDPILAEAISTEQYQVSLQRYGPGDCWVRERRGGWFVVEGEPGLVFGWEVKAKQRDYDQRRLERDDDPYTVPAATYGIDAAEYIASIRRERFE